MAQLQELIIKRLTMMNLDKAEVHQWHSQDLNKILVLNNQIKSRIHYLVFKEVTDNLEHNLSMQLVGVEPLQKS